MLPPMRAYSRLEWLQNEELFIELDNKPPHNSSTREQVGEYLYADSKESFDAPYTVDAEFYGIIEISRTTKLQ